MNTYILILITLFSLIGMIFILINQVIKNRQAGIDSSQFSGFSVAGILIDYMAFKIVYFCREIIYKLYVFSMFFIRNLLSVIRYAVIRVEKRFHRVTVKLQGRQIIHRNDSVSFFLREIKEHKDSVVAGLHNGKKI